MIGSRKLMIPRTLYGSHHLPKFQILRLHTSMLLMHRFVTFN